MAGAASQSLNFRVFHCSSQDPSFPVGELINQGKDQSQLAGWQSQRFCVYPQEIVIQFPCLVHLKQVQFLVHQSKIPSRIELYVYAPDFNQGASGNLVSANNASISFERLGQFSLDDNIRTNYQARELKTVYLEQYCQYLKIVLHKNHLNSQNIFNQIGLISLTSTGGYIGDYEASAMIQAQQRGGVQDYKGNNGSSLPEGGSLVPRNLKLAGVNEDELDEAVQEKIRVLNEAKLQAVDEEDFDKAKHLKDAVDMLKLAGSRLNQLEIQKKVAIENEDFDSAKVLKYEIERLRNMASTLDTERIIHAPIRQSINSQTMHENHQHTVSGQHMNGQDNRDPYGEDQFEETDENAHHRMMMSIEGEDNNQQQFRGDHSNQQQQFYSLEESKIQQQHQDYRSQHSQHNQDVNRSQMMENPMNQSQREIIHTTSQQLVSQHSKIDNKLQSKNSLKSSNNEDQIVPALSMKGPIDFNTVGDNEYDGGVSSSRDADNNVSASQEELKLSNIASSQKPIADAMVPLFGEQTACLIFARAWGNREKGIDQVISQMDEVLSKDSETSSHNTVLQLMTECLKDKVQKVTTKAFQLVDAYIASLQRNKSVNPKSDMSNTEKMLVQLLDRLADSKFSLKAEQCYFQLFQVEQLDGNFLISFLLKSSSFLNKNMASSFHHLVPRLTMINSILVDFPKYENDLKKTSASTFPISSLIAKIKEGVDASNPEHRKICLQLIVSLNSQFGFKKIEVLVGELPLKSLEVLAKDIPEADAYYKAKKHQPSIKKD